MLSLDLDEVMTISDRIAVIYEGKIMAVTDKENADVDHTIGLLMGGNVGKSGFQKLLVSRKKMKVHHNSAEVN